MEAGLIEQLVLEADGAVFQRAELVVKVGIDGAGVDDLVGQRVQLGLVGEIVGVQADFDAVQQVRDHLRVAADGDALIQGIKVVVVKRQAHGQALDDEGGQIFAVASPLLFGVALDELLVDVAADEGDGLFFEILRLVGDLLALLLDLGGGFLRRHDAPHLVEGVHVKGQRIELALVVGNGRVREAVELCKPGDVVPDFFVVGMENMGAVLVDVDALDVLGIDVAGDVRALVDDQHAFAVRLCLVGKNRTVQPGTDYQIIIHILHSPVTPAGDSGTIDLVYHILHRKSMFRRQKSGRTNISSIICYFFPLTAAGSSFYTDSIWFYTNFKGSLPCIRRKPFPGAGLRWLN